MGHVNSCAICGGEPHTAVGDCCFNIVRYQHAGDPRVARVDLPGSVMLPTAADGINAMGNYVESGDGSDGKCGDSKWTAAEMQRSATSPKLAVTGGAYATCEHRSVLAFFTISTKERLLYHIILLLIAFAMGASVYAVDVACLLRRHMATQVGKDIGFADDLFAALFTMLAGHGVRFLMKGVASPPRTGVVISAQARDTAIAEACLTGGRGGTGMSAGLAGEKLLLS